MLMPGQVFRLISDIVAIELFEDRTRAVVIPAGNTISVVKYPCASDDRMADVLWDNRPVVVFGLDIHRRAKVIDRDCEVFSSALVKFDGLERSHAEAIQMLSANAEVGELLLLLSPLPLRLHRMRPWPGR